MLYYSLFQCFPTARCQALFLAKNSRCGQRKSAKRSKKKEDREEMNSKDMKNKRVFITGATGFVGAHITKHLIELGANVTVLIERCDSTSYFSI